MKSSNLLVVLTIIAFLLISEGALIVHAQTLTKDFGTVNVNNPPNIIASMDVKATVQTEPNGHWIQNNTYQVNLQISIPYVNESVYNANGFAIECRSPDNPVYNAFMNPSQYNIDVTVTPQNSGTMSYTLRPQSTGNTSLNLDFALIVYYNNKIVTSGSWVWYMNSNKDVTNQPLSIMVDSNQHLPFDTPTVPELTPLAIILTLAVVTSSVAIYSKKVKSGKLKS